jgi:hypothetical protein
MIKFTLNTLLLLRSRYYDYIHSYILVLLHI